MRVCVCVCLKTGCQFVVSQTCAAGNPKSHPGNFRFKVRGSTLEIKGKILCPLCVCVREGVSSRATEKGICVVGLSSPSEDLVRLPFWLMSSLWLLVTSFVPNVFFVACFCFLLFISIFVMVSLHLVEGRDTVFSFPPRSSVSLGSRFRNCCVLSCGWCCLVPISRLSFLVSSCPSKLFFNPELPLFFKIECMLWLLILKN